MIAYTINHTHSPSLASWVSSANVADCDFPIQNLPFGAFRRAGSNEPPRIGVAIGSEILDLGQVGLISHGDMNRLMSMSISDRHQLRSALSSGLAADAAQQQSWTEALVPQSAVEMAVPCRIGDYTDFYTSIHHATSVGRMFRPEAPLLPNYKWIPIGYHGRSSSIGVSGQKFKRPVAQVRAHPEEAPSLVPTRRLDFELELGVFIGSGNAAGDAVPLNRAEQHAFGVVLLNDWSARDVQAWEYQPLGPFLSKNFATTISPWMVTMEALAPFRTPSVPRAPGDPEPLPYLASSHNQQYGGIDIQLEVWLETPQMRTTRAPAERIVQSSFAAAYWTLAQMITHHTVNGCNLQPGDLLGTGTQSGPLPENAGSLLELSAGGKRPLRLHTGESRTFLEDGDAVNLKAFCVAEGARRIGFGDCSGQVLPATTTHVVASS